jgi:methyl-accepting chemotaxis protein
MRLTIKRKLLFGFSFTAILLVGSTSIAHWAQARAEATQQQITRTMGMLNDLEYLISYLRNVTVVQRAYLISGNENDIAGIPAMRQDADVVAKRVIAAIGNDAEQKNHFSQYLEDLRQRRAFVNQLNATRKNQGFDAAKALFSTGEDNRLLGATIGEFDAMKSMANAELNAEEIAEAKLQRKIVWLEAIAILIALALITVIALTLTRSIARNIQISVRLVEAMANKDLTITDGVPASDDELAAAIHAINRMKQSMTSALREVAGTSAQVAGAGTEIESTAKEMAEVTHGEQRSVEQFASSIAEMNVTERNVAENAEHASLAATDAVNSAKSGQEVVGDTQDAMNRIRESVNTASTDINELVKVTHSIGEAVRIIQDIAGQTNLLALNAAIEAARAGEQGKGFAVVAQEVRQLAERTSKFTKEIAQKIESMQHVAGRAVTSMQEGESVVGDGVRKFNDVGQALEVIMHRIEATQQGIAIIATASTQQSAATSELTEHIHGISSNVAQTVQQVDQTALACAELARLAGGMQALVNTFQLPPERRENIREQAPSFGRRAA